MRYIDVIFLQGDDYDEMEEACTVGTYVPDYHMTFKYVEPEKVLEYLKQWHSGDESEESDNTDLCGRQCLTSYETEHYVAKWCRSHAIASLWFKSDD